MSREKIRVLYVDNEPDLGELVTTYLKRESERIDAVWETEPKDGLKQLNNGEIDCVVANYMMPEMNGLEFYEEIQEGHPDVPFILFTGKGSEEIAGEAVSVGVDDYIRKRGGTNQYKVLAKRIENLVSQRRAEISYREIFEKASDGMTIHDKDTGEILNSNQEFCDMIGYTKEELLELDFGEILAGEPPYTEERARELIRKAGEGEPQRFEWLDKTQAGENIWVEVTLKPVKIRGQDRVLASVRDITEMKERERELERQKERLEEFADVVSHDLRNPLNVAQGHAELIKETGKKEYVESTIRALERIDTILDDLLKLAKQGQVVGEMDEVDLEKLVRSCWSNVETGNANVQLIGELEMIEADGGRLSELLENLFNNAVVHGGEDVTVRVGMLEDGFYVEDNGPGIPEDKRRKVFKHGYSTREEGTGFGLSIVKSIVEAHGWDISVKEGRDGGARFEITGVK